MSYTSPSKMQTISFLILLFTLAKAYNGLQEEKMYQHDRLEKICPENGGKYQVSVKTVTVLTFSSHLMDWDLFKCHLELEVTSSSYGFSVFIEEMTLEASDKAGCQEDYIQFGRDILFVTSHKSKKYCGVIEAPVARKGEGVSGFSFPKTPLVKRIYAEENDNEMDLWIQVTTPPTGARPKTFTLVITPFKKYCGQNDLYYRQCRYSTKCIRKELFCDGRVNCAWPYSEPADEVYCKQSSGGTAAVWNISNFPVISVVLMIIIAVLLVFCCGLVKFIERVKQSKREEEDSSSNGTKTHLEDLQEINAKIKVQKHQKDIKELTTLLGVTKHPDDFKELATMLEEPEHHEDLKEFNTRLAAQKQQEDFRQLTNILDVHIVPSCPPLPSPTSLYPPLPSPTSDHAPLQSPTSIYPSLSSPTCTHPPLPPPISKIPPIAPPIPPVCYSSPLPEKPLHPPPYTDSCTPSVPNTTSYEYFTQLHKPS